MRVSQLTGRRTNSLGWAKSDCHSCASRGRHCDRRRPRCSPCLTEGTTCSGYVQQLNWERGTVRPAKRRSKARPEHIESAKVDSAISQLPRPDAFVFVDPKGTHKRQRRRSRTNSRSSNSTVSTADPVELVTSDSVYDEGCTSPSPSSSWSLTTPGTPPAFELKLSPRIKYNTESVESSLLFFHSCFAYTTLTFEVKVNPWQACLPSIHGDLPCVRYAAVALAQRQQAHISGKPEGVNILRLKAKALSLFASQLDQLSFETGLSTALLLIALDYAETGVSNWVIHLRGAYRILESQGGIRLAESRPGLRAQIAMFIWYDVAAAMISRCGPVFPRTYLEALMAWQADNEWSILALNGLPDGMFLDMQELAVAASQGEHADFDHIDAIRTRIFESKIKPASEKYQVLMSQVWKLGLLLYCSRVFPYDSATSKPENEEGEDVNAVLVSNEKVKTPLDPHLLAEQILRIVAEIPSDSNFQKQCLMPIILAGCEITASRQMYRKIALEYSELWKQRTGIWIFDSGLEFMRGVWARNERKSVNELVDRNGKAWVPWTEVYVPSGGHGFMFG